MIRNYIVYCLIVYAYGINLNSVRVYNSFLLFMYSVSIRQAQYTRSTGARGPGQSYPRERPLELCPGQVMSVGFELYNRTTSAGGGEFTPYEL